MKGTRTEILSMNCHVDEDVYAKGKATTCTCTDCACMRHLAKKASDGWFPASIQFIKSSVSTWRWLIYQFPRGGI